MTAVLGVILAGGTSRRMGADKAMVDLAGRPLASWVHQALDQTCEEVVVAGREGLLDLPGVVDPPSTNRGPLAGLVSALQRGQPLLAVAVDQPWVRWQTLRQLALEEADMAVVPVEDGVRQTTCAYYPPTLLDLARQELQGGGSLQSLLDLASFIAITEPTWRAWGEDGRSWFSVDTADDLDRGLIRYGRPG